MLNHQSEQGRIYINKEQYFEGVPPEVWNFHVGGYQVCQKWLKDRKGRTLTFEDIQHYQRVVSALAEAIELMGQIDVAIEEYRDGQLSDRVDKGVDGCGGLITRATHVFPTQGGASAPPNSTPLPPLRNQGILELVHKGNTFPTKSRTRWYNEIKVLCG